jgi:hypothetical protein
LKVNFFILVLATFHNSLSFFGSMVTNFICYLQHLHKKFISFYISCFILRTTSFFYSCFVSKRRSQSHGSLACRKNMFNKCQFWFSLPSIFAFSNSFGFRESFFLGDTLWVLLFSTVIAIQYYHIINFYGYFGIYQKV